ncbi:MAG: hypothetical protein HC810_07015 [Acaryochloridaceae cyanobacterium RL_2_7]|nr:hypothetical protein [Acaryochloridaceae cyanobacterium RL_2_7]
MFGAITGIFGGILGTVTGIFTKKKKQGEFFLEIDGSKDSAAATAPAKTSAPTGKKAKPATVAPAPQAAAPVAVVNQSLNIPAPKVTATIEPLDIPKFGPRRRPGSNMQSFLDMAKTVKS